MISVFIWALTISTLTLDRTHNSLHILKSRRNNESTYVFRRSSLIFHKNGASALLPIPFRNPSFLGLFEDRSFKETAFIHSYFSALLSLDSGLPFLIRKYKLVIWKMKLLRFILFLFCFEVYHGQVIYMTSSEISYNVTFSCKLGHFCLSGLLSEDDS